MRRERVRVLHGPMVQTSCVNNGSWFSCWYFFVVERCFPYDEYRECEWCEFGRLGEVAVFCELVKFVVNYGTVSG